MAARSSGLLDPRPWTHESKNTRAFAPRFLLSRHRQNTRSSVSAKLTTRMKRLGGLPGKGDFPQRASPRARALLPGTTGRVTIFHRWQCGTVRENRGAPVTPRRWQSPEDGTKTGRKMKQGIPLDEQHNLARVRVSQGRTAHQRQYISTRTRRKEKPIQLQKGSSAERPSRDCCRRLPKETHRRSEFEAGAGKTLRHPKVNRNRAHADVLHLAENSIDDPREDNGEKRTICHPAGRGQNGGNGTIEVRDKRRRFRRAQPPHQLFERVMFSTKIGASGHFGLSSMPGRSSNSAQTRRTHGLSRQTD